MPKNGVVGEVTLNIEKAADGRHPPFITSFTLPNTHAAYPAGTLMAAGENPGTAKADITSTGDTIIGVLNEAVEANEDVGNVMLHGSCPVEILKWVDGVTADANEAQIKALRGIGIYV